MWCNHSRRRDWFELDRELRRATNSRNFPAIIGKKSQSLIEHSLWSRENFDQTLPYGQVSAKVSDGAKSDSCGLHVKSMGLGFWRQLETHPSEYKSCQSTWCNIQAWTRAGNPWLRLQRSFLGKRHATAFFSSSFCVAKIASSQGHHLRCWNAHNAQECSLQLQSYFSQWKNTSDPSENDTC